MAATFQTLAVNQLAATGYGQNYPFAPCPAGLQYLLGDFWLSYPDDNCAYVLPLRVTRLTGFDDVTTGTPHIVVQDAEGEVVFDSADGVFVRAAWGVNLVTLSWVNGEAVLRCTVRTMPPPWEPDLVWPADIETDAVLDARTYQQLPRRVRSIIVGLQTFNAVDLQLVEGFNIKLTAPAVVNVDGGRRVNRVVLRGRPGDGLGRVAGCEDTTPKVQRINAISPSKSGDFIVDTDGCYRIQRPATLTGDSPRTVELGHESLSAADGKAALQIFNDCGPCCPCDDFVRTYEGIRKLFYRYQALGERAESTRDLYATNIDRWERQKACRITQSIRLVLSAERYGVLFVGGVHCNGTECCVTPVILRTTFEYFRDGSPITIAAPIQQCKESKRAGSDTEHNEVPYVPSTAWPVMDHHFAYVEPQGQSRFRNRLRFAAEDADTVRVTLTAHMPDSINTATTEPCDIPVVTVPSGVLAIWAATSQPPYPARAITQRVSPVSQTAGGGGCP